MENIFFYSAIFGGTLLMCQFVASLIGLDDDVENGESSFETDDLSGDSFYSTWLFSVISFKTLVAAITFFGMSGMYMHHAGASQRDQLLIATIAGLASMYGVHWLMRSFRRLGTNSTLQIKNAVGQSGRVTVSIPGSRKGMGRVQLVIQGRMEEFPAISEEESGIPSGSSIKVSAIEQTNTLLVERQSHTEPQLVG